MSQSGTPQGWSIPSWTSSDDSRPPLIRPASIQSLTPRRDTYPFIDPFRFRDTLVGQIVLIPNASRGVAKATALAFAQAGATLVLTAPLVSALDPVLNDIRLRFQAPVFGLAADFKDPHIPKKLIDHVQNNLGPIEILINVVVGSGLNSFSHETDFMGNWWSNMERSVRTPIALIHAVLPSMTSRGHGTIISTGADTGVFHIPFTTADSSARAALLRFHIGLHHEIGPKGINSFFVNPGLIGSYLYDPDVVINQPKHFEQEPRMAEEVNRHVGLVMDTSERGWSAVGLPAGTFLALCVVPRAKLLNGLYINAERDLQEMIADAEQGENSRIVQERLYTFKIDEL